ncbi:MAG: Ger(x)C family spore germination protein [Desulfitobacteriaceae bacterium]
MKKTITYTVILVLLLSLTGCWNKRETENLAITTAIGIDMIKLDGKDIYKLSEIILRPRKLGVSSKGTAGGSEQTYEVLESQGQSLDEAVRNLTAKIPRITFLAHTQVIILGQAVCEENLNEVLDFLTRGSGIRFRSLIFVTKGDTCEVLQAKPTMESELSKEIYGIGSYSKTQSSEVQEITLKNFSEKMITPGLDAWAPVLEVTITDKLKNENNLKVNGLALFKAEKLGGWLNKTDTQGIMLADSEDKHGSLTVPVGDRGQIAYVFNQSSKKVSVQINEEKDISVTIIVKLSGELVESKAYPLDNLEDIKLAEIALNQAFEEQISSAFKQSQESESDILGIGRLVERKDKALWDSIKEQWPKMYSRVEINIKVDSKIMQTGLRNKTFNGKFTK